MRRRFYITLFAFLLAFFYAHGQTTYDFKDKTIYTNGKSTDGSLKLSGTYGYNGTTYGIDMKVGSKIKIAVSGSSTLKFLGSQYSSLSLQGSSKAGVDLGTQLTKTATDLKDTYDFVYVGVADTLIFTAVLTSGGGSDIYLPTIVVTPAQAGGSSTLTAPVKNIIYYFDLRDGSIIPNQTSLNGNYTINQGLFKVECGPSNAYGYNGAQHGSIIKAGNKITLQVAGNSYIKIGGCKYSSGTISVSSSTGNFDITSQTNKTTNCYDQDGSSIQFLYVGTAGSVVLDFTGTNYIPYIEIDPYPYAKDLVQWVQKSGQIVVNGVAVNLTAGANASANPTVTVAAGTVISATPDVASIRINLGGKSLSSVTTTFSGNISAVKVNSDTLKITYADAATKPYSYMIKVADNSSAVSAQAGKTYSYMFMDGSVIPQTAYSALRYSTFITPDGILTINSNTTTTSQQFGYHDSAHGIVMFSGNSMNFVVAGNATITFSTCMYGAAADAIFTFTDASGKVLGTVQGTDKGSSTEGTHSFAYTGSAGVITATLNSVLAPTGEFYIHGVSIENAASIIKTAKTDIWDFGAAQKDPTLYNNRLTESIINSWYPGVTAGTAGTALPGGFTVGVLSWVGGTNSDRLRTSNTNLTRYDANSCPAYVGNDTITGLLYVNASATSARYIGLTLSADDEVSIYAKSQNGTGKLNFQYMADATQTDIAPITTDVSIVKFVAKKTGSYHIFDSADKPFYYRILRKDATYATLSGTLDLSNAAGIPSGYSIVFTNVAGKSWSDTIPSGTNYSIKLPSGYTYSLSLANASGYIITNGAQVTVNGDATRTIAIKKVLMYAVTGAVKGLNSTLLSKLALTYTPAISKIYVPQPIVNTTASTYSVMLEPSCRYQVTATGVNDYYIPLDTINISGITTKDITFAPKPVYKVTINTTGLDSIQRSKLNVTFTNLNESGYSYKFAKVDSIYLRTGVYTVSCSGLDLYPLQLGATSNLNVNGAAASKTLAFTPVTDWSFDDATITSGTTTSYKGMLFTGTVANEIAKGHLVLTGNSTVKVPVKSGQKVVITYYYSAKFVVVAGDTVKTSSGSTSTFETKEYIYSGTVPGFMTITNITGTTTYLTDVAVAQSLPYSATITVGIGKNYQTINNALAAARAMVRPNKERVSIMIDPGNYEEMLVVDIQNVSLINASSSPSIALANKGVDISINAVRITSYYGHGYNYYSMGTDQKWSADALRVNKENGYTTYANTGSGTTNGSYWNTTVIVSAAGFQASNIIFENSYNQYISKKESQDVVVEWASGGKGTRPTDYGNTAVQNKSFVERAAAIAFTSSADKAILNKCRVVGRQDSFYGAEGARVVAYKGSLMGGTDYIFGGMTLVCYMSDLAMNTSDASTDVAYITAAQQSTSRGFLMYGCKVTSAAYLSETASALMSKPGEFGRPWQATTSEVVFYNTTIESTNATGFLGKSLISPEGWLNTLGGTSSKMYEFGTIEKSGENNKSSRATWSSVLATPTLTDGTAITTFNFTKGTDSWDPIPSLIASDVNTEVVAPRSVSSTQIYSYGNKLFISNVESNTLINIYSLDGVLAKSCRANGDTNFTLDKGVWIVKAIGTDGNKVVKVLSK
jgi:pectin methylesterase-like acyl-CoA thioesterase